MSTPQNPMMQQAMGMMSNPNAQAVPQQQPGVIDPSQHPVIAAIIKALASGMQGFSQTAMDPRERMQRQEMDAQKAEALGRMGIQQQQVGIEQQRANTEQQGVEQTGKYQTGELGESAKRTAILGREADTGKQRADQSYEVEKKRLQIEADKASAEYGAGGLRSREVGATESTAKSTASRAATDAKMATIADAREKLEAQYKQAEAQRAGLSTDRATLEDERKARIAAVQEIYGKSPWYETRSSSLGKVQAKVQEINDDINARIAQAEKAAGTGAGAATPSASGVTHVWNGTGIQPVPQKPR